MYINFAKTISFITSEQAILAHKMYGSKQNVFKF